MKKVSIIIPLYKSENYLPKLLDSVINQSYPNLEIILVDDGSPDYSGKIADDYASNDHRISVIHQQNAGTCAARNAGLKRASGEYLMFADGDDWLELDCVEYLVKILEENNCQMSMTDCVFTTRDRRQNEIDKVRVWSNKEAVAGILNTFIIPVGPWNKLYDSRVIHEHNISFSVPWFGEGLYFSTMAAQYSHKVAVGHRKIYDYRLNNPNSGTTERHVQNGINSLNNIFYIRDTLNVGSPDITDAINWHIWMNANNLIVYIVGADSGKEYRDKLFESKRYLRHYMPLALKNRFLSLRQRVSIMIATCLPVLNAKRLLRKTQTAFEKDIEA